MTKKLEGKVAIITGANSGIGESVAKLFAAEGATVVITARRMEPLEKVAEAIATQGGKALPLSVDVAKEDQVKNMVAATIDKYGKIDILVNCAGVLDNNTSLGNADDDLFHKVININTLGPFHCIREVLPHMLAAKKGNIVNVASVAGYYGFGGGAYATSKGAAIAMTKSTAARYGTEGIRCNCICPAAVNTPMTTPEALAGTDMAQVDAIMSHTCTNIAPTEPSEQAKVLLFLASDDSSAINGQAIITDRGANM